MRAPPRGTLAFAALDAEARLRARGRFSAAARLLESAAGRAPATPELHFRLGWLRDAEGRAADARAAFGRYLAAGEPDRARRFLARAARGEYAEAAGEAERLAAEAGLPAIDRVFHPWVDDWFPPRPPSYHEARLGALDRARFESPWRFFFRGLLLSCAGRPREGLAELDRLAALPQARYGWLRYAAGLRRLRLGWHEEAAEDLSAALRSRPGFWLAGGHLAEALLCLGDERAAFAAFARSARGPAAAEVRAWRGEALLWLGRLDEAHAELDRARGEGSWFALAWRGAARTLLGRHAQALRDLDQAAGAGTRDAELLLWRGELKRRMGKPREAAADLDLALEYGGGLWARVNRALAAGALGDRAGLWSGVEALPEALVRRLWPVQGADDAAAARLLEAALEAARGLRRPESYLEPLWRRDRRGAP